MLRRTAALVLVLVLVELPAAAQDYVWTRANGPDGGDCRAIAFAPGSPSRVLAGLYRGIHISTDGGVTWGLVPTESFVPHAFAFDPSDSQVVYAATNGGALQKSTNAGSSWSRIRITPADPQPSLLCVAVDPGDSRRVYVGAESRGVYRTTDGGASWTQTSSGMGNVSIRVLLIDPSNASRLTAAGFGGVYVSTDGGDTWSVSNMGLTNTDVRDLALSPGDSQTIYAATAGGVFKSTDGGVTWSGRGSGLNEPVVNSIAVDPGDPSVLYAGTKAGVFRSSDSADSWQYRGAGMEKQDYVQVVEVDPANGQKLLAGTGGSIFRSANSGGNWTVSASGLFGLRCQALSSTAAKPGRVIVGCGTGVYGAGVYRSDDWGLTWELIGIGNEYVDTVACGWTDPDLYFGTSGNGIFRTLDGGSTWDRTPQGGRMHGLCVDRANPMRFYGASYGQAVWRTLDGGDTWAQCGAGMTNSLTRSVAIDFARPSRLYAGVDATGSMPGLFRTLDGGDNWSPATSGVIGQRIWAIAVDPTDGAVYAGGYSGLVFRSTDAGASFAQVASLGATVASLAVDPVTRHVYAGTTGGVYRSMNLGSSFTKLTGYNQLALSLLVDPNNHGFLYVGSDGDRVWRCSFRADAPSIRAAKAYPDGQLVRIGAATVTAVYDGRFYIEDDDRTAGIAVVSSEPVMEGDNLTVTGVLRVADGERHIVASSITAD
jgi:photosystem II stability/assembly factor-like uncharacterized protein